MEQTTNNSTQKPLADLTIIIGLPGSGKSTYLSSLAESNQNLSVYDDYHGGAYGDDPDPKLSRHFGPMLADLRQAKSVVVSDIRFCAPVGLNAFLGAVLSAAPNVRVSLKYFENDPEACKQNILSRNREGMVNDELELLDKLSAGYSVLSVEKLNVHRQS